MISICKYKIRKFCHCSTVYYFVLLGGNLHWRFKRDFWLIFYRAKNRTSIRFNLFSFLFFKSDLLIQLEILLTPSFSSQSSLGSLTNINNQSRSSGVVVMGGDWWARGREFESQHGILNGSFFTFICCKNCAVVWRGV